MAARAASLAGLRPSARDTGKYMLGVADELRSFIGEDLGWNGCAGQFTDDLPLSREAALDSLGIRTLVDFLDSTDDIAIDDSEIVADHFGGLADIEKFVLRKKA